MEPLQLFLGCFLFVLGTCVGSFLNVVIWRLPYKIQGAQVTYKGKTGLLTLSWPPSHCPNCDAGIPWYLNLPVFGWLIIAGRCANCRKPIALRYPMVELATGALFLVTYMAYSAGLRPDGAPASVLNLDAVSLTHEWPALFLHLIFISILLAAAAIDADSYQIPLILPTVLAAVAILSAPFIDSTLIPTIDADRWNWAKPVIGGAAGLIIANILLWLKVLPLSFANLPGDPPETKTPPKEVAGKTKEKSPDKTSPDDANRVPPIPLITYKLPIVITTILAVFAAAIAWAMAPANWAALVTILCGILIFLVGVLSRDADAPDATDEVLEEISAPGARTEMMKEALFLLFPFAGAILAYYLPFNLPHAPWLARLLGVMLGFLVGGGSIWVVRVLGSLAFGKEAMGLGDVHLMAAAGAVLGPILVLVAFPMFAPLLGVAWTVLRLATRRQSILPFGPWLAIASILALFAGYPVIHWYIKNMLGQH
jgi:leader peptidase (prepilin peptidase) / N-methyltransferase